MSRIDSVLTQQQYFAQLLFGTIGRLFWLGVHLCLLAGFAAVAQHSGALAVMANEGINSNVMILTLAATLPAIVVLSWRRGVGSKWLFTPAVKIAGIYIYLRFSGVRVATLVGYITLSAAIPAVFS